MIDEETFLSLSAEMQYAESRCELLAAIQMHAESLTKRVLPLRNASEFAPEHWQVCDRRMLVQVMKDVDALQMEGDGAAFRRALLVKGLVQLTIMTGDRFANARASKNQDRN